MGKFWDLYEKNVVISGLLALMLVGGVVVMAVRGQEVPVLLASLASAACGYFFGAGKAKDVAIAIRGK